MDRIDFIKALADELAYEVKPSEIHQLINYYDEIIQDLMEDGYSEIEAVAKLGSPRKLAKEAAGIQEVEIEIPRRFNPFVIVMLIIGFPLWGSLLLTAVLLLLSFYLVIWCVPFTTAVFGVTAVFAGIVSAVFSPLVMGGALFMGVTQLGIGTLFFGLGILSLVLTYSISGFFLRVTKKTSIAFKNLLFRRRKQVVRI